MRYRPSAPLCFFRLKARCIVCAMKINYTQAVLKFLKLDTQAQQREAVVQGRSLSPYRLRYTRLDAKSFFIRLVI
ncbi:MAG: hypothetical protein LBJ00_01660 [Planctomycetaceae bacterium]|nr:hypothetical protein [Planctomycetaceae bacterium]